MRVKEIAHRLRNDFHLAVNTLMGSIALVGITPFALYRLYRGEWLALAMDLLIELCIVATVVYAWRSGNTRTSGLIQAFFNSASALIAALVLGTTGLFWLYCVFLSNFFIVSRSIAFSAAIIMLAGLVYDGRLFPTTAYAASFIVTSLVVCLFAFAFAYRAELQRKQLEALASSDALTGVNNRRTLDEEISRAHKRFQQTGLEYGLLLLDLDHFKRVNDNWGHEAGDAVLIDFVKIIEKSVRKTDLLFRYGGEEFLLLVSAVNRQSLQRIADNLCRQVEAQLRCHEQTVTVSIGGAAIRAAESTDDWLARADAALYRAKRSGRNRAEVAPAEPTGHPGDPTAPLQKEPHLGRTP